MSLVQPLILLCLLVVSYLTAAADSENWTVSLAGEVWKAIPGELIAPGLGPFLAVVFKE